MELAPNPRYSRGSEALGGSFKLVTLAPKTKGDDSTAQGNIKEWGHTNKSKSTSEHKAQT